MIIPLIRTTTWHAPCTQVFLKVMPLSWSSAYPCTPCCHLHSCQVMNPKAREGVSSVYCCKLPEAKLQITTVLLQAERSSPPRLPSQTISCLGLGVLCFRFISFPYLGTGMCPGTQAKSSRFITVLMTASCMLSEFCNPPQLLLLPRPMELQDAADYRDCYLHMKNGSVGKCN